MQLNEKELESVTISWSTKYAVPVFTLANGKSYIASTGEYAGYYEEVQVEL